MAFNIFRQKANRQVTIFSNENIPSFAKTALKAVESALNNAANRMNACCAGDADGVDCKEQVQSILSWPCKTAASRMKTHFTA
jgi:hypothetical protein